MAGVGACLRGDERGQSLVEIALALPLLLVTLLGLVDLGRAFVYTTAVTNAAREAAMYEVYDPSATAAQVQQHACNETGLSDYNAPCASGITVTCTPCPSYGADVTVEVKYRFSLISGYLTTLFGSSTLTARGSATFPGIGQ
jgi:Flp pilus assembly protein TadG